MKVLLSILVLMGSATSFASNQTISVNCTATHNYKVVIEQQLEIAPGSVGNKIGEYEGFSVIYNQRDHSSELELYNVNEESRSYAKAQLRNVGDQIELARWTRESIFEVKCERAK